MFLELIKKIGWLLLFLTIVYTVPSLALIARSYELIKANLKEDDSIIAIFSFGAYIINS